MKFITKIIALLIFISFNHYATAQYKIVKNVAVKFKIKNAGMGVDGKFSSVTATAFLDETNPSKSVFTGVIETNSATTGIKLRDKHIKEKEEFFDVAKYPTMSMKSVSVTLKSVGIYTVIWDLNMKGVTRRFSSEIKTVKQNENILVSTEFKINRNDWKVGGNSFTMGDMVTINLNTTLAK
jgi:polyisoprenoid-binding protein YceI